MRKRINHSVQL